MFFIAGTPRTRTKWFAEYLSAHEGVTCHHEALNGPLTKQAFYDVMEQPGCVGNSDSGIFITDFQERWPDAPTVILLRGPIEVRDSLWALLGAEPNLAFIENQYEQSKALNGLQVDYRDIDDRIEEIHEHLGIPFDTKLFKKYTIRNIQIDELKVCMDSYKLWLNFGEVA
jgi:hypothetical protein